MGGKFHLKLITGLRPIAYKYCEGKVKRTLKRELKVPEIVGREANEISSAQHDWILRFGLCVSLAKADLCIMRKIMIRVMLSESIMADVLL